MQNTALPNGFIAGDARGCGQELSPPSECCSCHAQPLLERVPPGLPGEDSVVCLLTVGGNVATYVQLWPDRLSAHEKARGEAGFYCPEWPCIVSRVSCAILLIQCSSPQKGPTRREEARALALSSRCWVRTWRHSCYSTSMVFFCVEPGRDGDGRPAWSRIQELPHCVSNILLKNPVVCQYVSFQFSSGKFHWQEKYL